MSEHIGHHCAVAGVQRPDPSVDVSVDLAQILDANWNRGGAGFGIATTGPQGVIRIVSKAREHGVLLDIIRGCHVPEEGSADEPGSAGLGHDRYVTSGSDVKGNRQPFTFTANGQQWSFVFNGNIANHRVLSDDPRFSDALEHDVDTDVIRLLLQRGIDAHGDDMESVFRELERTLDGCFNIVLMNGKGDMWAYRDGHGFRPLTHGTVTTDAGELRVVGSEDSAVAEAFSGQSVAMTDVAPGELVQLKVGQAVKTMAMTQGKVTRCFFEWVYFSKLLSMLDSVQVLAARKKFAEKMADAEAPFDSRDGKQRIVVGVPESAIVGGNHFAERTDIPYRQVIHRNPEAKERSFLRSKDDRLEYARKKYLFDDAEIVGKVIYLTEDSVVRGTTMDVLIHLLREKGAKEIHLRVSCPPIIAPCFYGIDFATLRELLVGKYRAEIVANGGDLTPEIEAEIAKELGLDSITFLAKEAMLDCFEELGLPRGEFCTACIDGTPDSYPTPAGRDRFLQEAAFAESVTRKQ